MATSNKNNKNKQSKNHLIGVFFEFLINIKFAHIVTQSFSKHYATDKLYDEFNELYDKFLEVYVAKYGRFETNKSQTISFEGKSDDQFKKYLKDFVNFLCKDIFQYIGNEDTDLISIIDDMKVSVFKTLYQLELK